MTIEAVAGNGTLAASVTSPSEAASNEAAPASISSTGANMALFDHVAQMQMESGFFTNLQIGGRPASETARRFLDGAKGFNEIGRKSKKNERTDADIALLEDAGARKKLQEGPASKPLHPAGSVLGDSEQTGEEDRTGLTRAELLKASGLATEVSFMVHITKALTKSIDSLIKGS